MLRNDFVSNSSSSSFIIAFKNKKTLQNFCNDLKEKYSDMSDDIDSFFNENKINPNEYTNSLTEDDINDHKLFYKGIYPSEQNDYEKIDEIIWGAEINDDIAIINIQ